jgi:ferredoxin
MEAKRNPIDPLITWAPDYCKHCFTCINICPVKNLKFKKDEMHSLDKCIQCQLCMKYCPDFALEVIPKAPPKTKKKARAKTKAKTRPKNSPKTGPKESAK